MKAVTWHGKRDVRVEQVPDPLLKGPTDAIIRVTSSGICGSDLHLYEVLGPFLNEGDVLGHEPIGFVEEVGSEVSNLRPGDRVVVPSRTATRSAWTTSPPIALRWTRLRRRTRWSSRRPTARSRYC